jgi:hypothetical protein
MTTLYFRGIIACGLLGLLLSGSWFTAVGIMLGAPPHVPTTYVAPIIDRCYHTSPLDCPYAKQFDEHGRAVPTIPFATRERAERFGTACPHCVKP